MKRKNNTTTQSNTNDLNIVSSEQEKADKVDNQRLDTEVKEEEKSKEDQKIENKPQTISRPKGGDPKNVETILAVQKEKEGEGDDLVSGQADSMPKDKAQEVGVNMKLAQVLDNQDKLKQNEQQLDEAGNLKDLRKDPASKEENELQQERERILKRIEELKEHSEEEYKEEIFTFVECDSSKSYRKRIKNFSLPFNTREKYEDTNRYRFKKKKNIDQIRKEVQKLKERRTMQKKKEDNKKNTQYIRNQNIMRKMHEELVRDKGGFAGQNSRINAGIHNNLINKNKVFGYNVPKKFTLESLGRMDYREFNPNQDKESDDEFKPSDVIDSEEGDIDDEIEEMYHFKARSVQNDNYGLVAVKNSVSAHQLHESGIGINKSQHLSPVISGRRQVKVEKQGNGIIMSGSKRKGVGGKVNQSMLPPQKRNNALNQHRYKAYKGNNTPVKKRGRSMVTHGHTSETRTRKKPLPGKYHSKVYKNNQHPALDYNHGNKRNAKLRVANNKSLVRANQYDAKSKIKQEQKLKNILRLQNKKGALRIGAKNRL